MKKIIFSTAVFLSLSIGTVSAGIGEVQITDGQIDRSFDPERTLYYVNRTTTAIPKISAEGATVVKTATDSENSIDRVTVLKDDETGKEYRFVICGLNNSTKISSFTISESGELNLNYSSPKAEGLNLIILKPLSAGAEECYDIENIDGTDDAGKVLAIEKLTEKEGTFKFNLPSDADMGMYKAVLGGEGILEKVYKTTFYVSENGMKDILKELNTLSGADSEEKQANTDSFIKKYAVMLNIDKEEYESIKDRSLFPEFLLGKEFADLDAALVAYDTAKALSYVNASGEDEILGFIEENQELFGVDFTMFNKLDNVTAVAGLIKETKYESVSDLANNFKKAAAISYINEAEPSEIEKRFEEVEDILLSDDLKQSYNKSADKTKVLKLLVNRNFADEEEFLKGLEMAIEESNKKPTTNNKKPSGGGGGGSAASYIPAVTEKVNEPENEKVITVTENLYDDIESVEWAREAIMLLSDRKIVNGKGDKKFAPNDYVTREEFVKMLVTALELESNNTTLNFEDVAEDSWYYQYVLVGVGNKVVSGKSETVFGVGENITREDMAVMTSRAMNAAKVTVNDVNNSLYFELNFDDVAEISDYAKDSVKQLVKKGIVSGVGNNLYSPKSNATRAQAAQMIYKVIKDI